MVKKPYKPFYEVCGVSLACQCRLELSHRKKYRSNRMNWRKCGVVAVLLLVAGCGGEKGSPVSQEQFGEQWPLTVPSGRLSCILFTSGRQIVTFIAPDGREYALNGHAKSPGFYPPIDPIHKPDPINPPAKKSIGVLIDEGLKLCPQA